MTKHRMSAQQLCSRGVHNSVLRKPTACSFSRDGLEIPPPHFPSASAHDVAWWRFYQVTLYGSFYTR